MAHGHGRHGHVPYVALPLAHYHHGKIRGLHAMPMGPRQQRRPHRDQEQEAHDNQQETRVTTTRRRRTHSPLPPPSPPKELGVVVDRRRAGSRGGSAPPLLIFFTHCHHRVLSLSPKPKGPIPFRARGLERAAAAEGGLERGSVVRALGTWSIYFLIFYFLEIARYSVVSPEHSESSPVKSLQVPSVSPQGSRPASEDERSMTALTLPFRSNGMDDPR